MRAPQGLASWGPVSATAAGEKSAPPLGKGGAWGTRWTLALRESPESSSPRCATPRKCPILRLGERPNSRAPRSLGSVNVCGHEETLISYDLASAPTHTASIVTALTILCETHRKSSEAAYARRVLRMHARMREGSHQTHATLSDGDDPRRPTTCVSVTLSVEAVVSRARLSDIAAAQRTAERTAMWSA